MSIARRWGAAAAIIAILLAITAFVVRARFSGSPATQPRAATSISQGHEPTAAPIQALKITFPKTPPYGPGYDTSGTYVQVSGIDGLAPVNAALRSLLVSAGADDTAPPTAGVGNGVYDTDGAKGFTSASTAVVSTMFLTNLIAPGGNDGQDWVSATLLVTSATPVQLAGLFTDYPKALAKISEIAKKHFTGTDECVQSVINDPIMGPHVLDGLDPDPKNYHNFALTPDGLVLGFGQGQIGIEACGADYIVIPWSAVRSLMTPASRTLIPELR